MRVTFRKYYDGPVPGTLSRLRRDGLSYAFRVYECARIFTMIAIQPLGCVGFTMDSYLERLRREISDVASDMSEADWRRAPEGRWSSAQIVEHLGRTYGTTAKMVELAVASSGAPAPVRTASLRERLTRLVVVQLGFLPSGLDAPEVVVPRGEMEPQQALQKALASLERMDAALDAAVERWGNGPVAMHMMLGPLSARQWCRFHYVHGHHHVKQMLQRSRKPGKRPILERAY